MAWDADWDDARRLARYVRQAGRCGLHRDEADRKMGGTAAYRKSAFGMAYGRGWVDVCGRYLVVPVRPRYPGRA
jgi:hypothetical protein